MDMASEERGSNFDDSIDTKSRQCCRSAPSLLSSPRLALLLVLGSFLFFAKSLSLLAFPVSLFVASYFYSYSFSFLNFILLSNL
jgi:hypothetical protein